MRDEIARFAADFSLLECCARSAADRSATGFGVGPNPTDFPGVGAFVQRIRWSRDHALSEFVIARAVDDWRYFVTQRGGVEIAINLPIAFLEDSRSVCQQIPDHPAFSGLIIEINGTEIVRN